MLTTTIGAFPKPDSIPLTDWFTKQHGDYTATYLDEMAATNDDALDAAVHDVVNAQVEAGIDIPTDGEIRRENYIHYLCRHLGGIDFENLSHRMIRGVTSSMLPTVTGPITLAGNSPLPRDFSVAQAATAQPVKITPPGPMTIIDSVVDAAYDDDVALGADLADGDQLPRPRARRGRVPPHPDRRAGSRPQAGRRARTRDRPARPLLRRAADRCHALGACVLRLPQSPRPGRLREGRPPRLCRGGRGARRDQHPGAVTRRRARPQRSRRSPPPLRDDHDRPRCDRYRPEPDRDGRRDPNSARRGTGAHLGRSADRGARLWARLPPRDLALAKLRNLAEAAHSFN